MRRASRQSKFPIFAPSRPTSTERCSICAKESQVAHRYESKIGRCAVCGKPSEVFVVIAIVRFDGTTDTTKNAVEFDTCGKCIESFLTTLALMGVNVSE